MKLITKMKGTLVIICTARQQNKPAAEIRQAFQEALDTAWSETWSPGNIQAQVKWQQLFHGARKPSVEEFIIGLATELKAKHSICPA